MSVFDNMYKQRQCSHMFARSLKKRCCQEPCVHISKESLNHQLLLFDTSIKPGFYMSTDTIVQSISSTYETLVDKQPRPFPFCKLPRELRNHVYTLAFDEVYRGRCTQEPTVGDLVIAKGESWLCVLR